MCTLRVSVPPGDFLLGCGSSGSRIKPAPPVGIAGFVSLLCHQPVGICCHCHPPRGCVLAALPSPTHELCACWECLLGMCLIPGNLLLFQTELLGCQLHSLVAKVPERKNNNEVCQSAAFRPHLAACALCWRLLCICTAGN